MSRIRCNILFKKRRLYQSLCRCFLSNSSDREINVVKSKVPDIFIPNNELLHEYVWKNVDKWYNKTALECLETGRCYTYYQVQEKSKKVSKFLRHSLALRKGDTVAINLPNVPEFAISFLGAVGAGLTVTTVNPAYTSDEISKQFANSKPKLVFTLNGLFNTVQESLKKIGSTEVLIVITKQQQSESIPQNAIDFHEICEGKFENSLDLDLNQDRPDPNDVAALPYSSGTTGLPKGVQLTHKSMIANMYQLSSPEFKINLDTEGDQQDVIPLFLPMFHVYALTIVFLNMFAHGCKLVTVPKFSSESFLKTLRLKSSVIFGVPPIVLMAINNPNIKYENMTSVRTVISGAAPLGATDIERFQSKTHGQIKFLQMYGLTEASPTITSQTEKLENGLKTGGSGFVFPNMKCKIVAVDDGSFTGLGPYESGELMMYGPQIMKGYHNNENATKEVITEDGWLRTGDIGYYDSDGHFFITDRLKELIKVKGFQVAPAELEEVLRSHPSVADAAVVGIPHEIYGEVPKAFVVLKKDTTVKSDSIKEFVASKVASYKALQGGIVLLDSLPRNPSGKLLRKQLKHF